MPLYARTERLRKRQIVADVGFVAWVAVWSAAALGVRQLLHGFGQAMREMANNAGDAAERLQAVAESLGQTPLIGNALSDPFIEMAAGYAGLAQSAGNISDLFDTTALILALVTFIVPIAIGLILWLPKRLRFAAGTGPEQALAASPHGLEVYALRALATAPAAELARISPDPMGAWRAGDPAVTYELAAWALARDGLEPPALPPRLDPPRSV
jgi:hypothetical protein